MTVFTILSRHFYVVYAKSLYYADILCILNNSADSIHWQTFFMSPKPIYYIISTFLCLSKMFECFFFFILTDKFPFLQQCGHLHVSASCRDFAPFNDWPENAFCRGTVTQVLIRYKQRRNCKGSYHDFKVC